MKVARLSSSIIYHGLEYASGEHWRTCCGKRVHRSRLCDESTDVNLIECLPCHRTYSVRKALDWKRPSTTPLARASRG